MTASNSHRIISVIIHCLHLGEASGEGNKIKTMEGNIDYSVMRFFTHDRWLQRVEVLAKDTDFNLKNSKNEGKESKDKRTMDITQSHTKVSEIFQYIEKPHNK